MPYHHHYDLSCDYNKTAAGHSALTGVALDGRGIYGIDPLVFVFNTNSSSGMYESTGTYPTNLDACGGHCKQSNPFFGSF